MTRQENAPTRILNALGNSDSVTAVTDRLRWRGNGASRESARHRHGVHLFRYDQSSGLLAGRVFFDPSLPWLAPGHLGV